MKTNSLSNQTEHLVTLQNVELTLAEQSIFNNISITFSKGDKVALLGNSGVGKSSLLKLIAGIFPPTKGYLNNRALRIGYVFQEPRLLPWLTVEENIVQAMKANNIDKVHSAAILTELLTKVELIQYKHYYPYQLSGGMAQRASLARAFSVDPDLLLLDEPFSALDPTLIEQLSTLLNQFLKPETTMIYVSHQIEQVLPLVRSCLLIRANTNLRQKELTWHSTVNQQEKESFLTQYNILNQ